MFEHSLYEPEIAAAPTGEGDFLHNYEIRNWDLGPRIYKILGIAALANVLGLVIAAQTSLLTMKGCDSPLVGGVCQVLDTVYVGAWLFGTEREFADEVYERTELGEDAEITFVDVTGVAPPLSYPEGYFQLANPVEYQAMLDAMNGVSTLPDMNDLAGIPVTPPVINGGSLLDTTPSLPPPNNSAIQGDLPTFGNDPGVAANPKPTRRRPGRGRPSTKPTLPDENDAVAEVTKKPTPELSISPQPTPDPKATADTGQADNFGVYINKRPLRERATETLNKVDAKQVNLSSPFNVTVVGTLGLAKDGKTVVLKDPKPLPPPVGYKNDPAMEKFVQDWILSVGDAGWFGYIDLLDGDKKIKQKTVIVNVQQTDTELVATIRSELPDENVAKTFASGLNSILGIAAPKTDGDERAFLQAARTSTDGKALLINVKFPKTQAQEMIQRKLAAEREPKQPNSTAEIRARDTSAQQ